MPSARRGFDRRCIQEGETAGGTQEKFVTVHRPKAKLRLRQRHDMARRE
jgi:hypothetical protein